MLCLGHMLEARAACIYQRVATLKGILDRNSDVRVDFLQAWRPTASSVSKPILKTIAFRNLNLIASKRRIIYDTPLIAAGSIARILAHSQVSASDASAKKRVDGGRLVVSLLELD